MNGCSVVFVQAVNQILASVLEIESALRWLKLVSAHSKT